MQISRGINDLSSYASFDNRAKEVEFDSLNGRGDGEHSTESLVEIYQIFVMQDIFIYGVAPLDWVWYFGSDDNNKFKLGSLDMAWGNKNTSISFVMTFDKFVERTIFHQDHSWRSLDMAIG